MPETVTIDGRGMTVRDAMREMWDRMQPLEARGFHPVSQVEIVDASKNQVIEAFEFTDPEFKAHLASDMHEGPMPKQGVKRPDERPHAPEKKGHYTYVARITLEL